MSKILRGGGTVERVLLDPHQALTRSRFWSEALCRRFLDHVAEQVRFKQPGAVKVAILGIRLARRTMLARELSTGTRNRCLLARAFALLGSAYYRVEGKLSKASHALTKAAQLAARCTEPDERSNIYMRQALLRAHEAQRPDGSFDQGIIATGLELAEQALCEAKSPIAKVRALNARGQLQMFANKPSAAGRDARRALELVDPRADSYDHVSSLTLLVWVLGFGDKAEREEAIGHLEKLRAALPSRSPEHRGRLLWAEALLYIRDPRRKARARRRLDQARRKFLDLGMQAEATAVTADLARIHPTGPVPELCNQLLTILDPGPLRQLVDYLRRARLTERVDLAERLRRISQGSGLLPAPAWPRP